MSYTSQDFETLLRERWTQLINSLKSAAPWLSHQECEECAQQAFLELWRRRSSVNRSSAVAYIFQVAKHESVNYIRQEREVELSKPLEVEGNEPHAVEDSKGYTDDLAVGDENSWKRYTASERELVIELRRRILDDRLDRALINKLRHFLRLVEKGAVTEVDCKILIAHFDAIATNDVRRVPDWLVQEAGKTAKQLRERKLYLIRLIEKTDDNEEQNNEY